MRDNSFKISYSRINTYLFCPQKYKMIYLENKYIPINPDIAFGNAIHKTLEERIAESGVPLTFGEEIDWGESRGTELW